MSGRNAFSPFTWQAWRSASGRFDLFGSSSTNDRYLRTAAVAVPLSWKLPQGARRRPLVENDRDDGVRQWEEYASEAKRVNRRRCTHGSGLAIVRLAGLH